MSITLGLKESKNELTFANGAESIVCGNSNYAVQISFSSNWESYSSKTAVLVINGEKNLVNFTGSSFNLPALPNANKMTMHIMANDSSVSLVTSNLEIELVPTDTSLDGDNFNEFTNYFAKVNTALTKLENGQYVAQTATNCTTSVNLTGNQTIAGTKNFIGAIQKNGVDVLNKNEVSNPNLLVNGNFQVNQRGLTTYDHSTSGSQGYTVDRLWTAVGASVIVNDNNSITIKNVSGTLNRHIIQYIDNYKNLLGKTLTFSMKVTDAIQGDIWKVALYDGSTLYDETTGTYANNGENVVAATITMPNSISSGRNKLGVIIYPRQTSTVNDTITIEYIKLEIGSHATPLSPRTFAEELAMCQRYFQADNLLNYNYNQTGIGQACSATKIFLKQSMTSQLRTIPTITFSTGSTIPTNLKLLSYSTGSATVSDSLTGLTAMRINMGELLIQATTTNLTIGNLYSIYIDAGDRIRIFYDAEIY